MMDPIFHNEKKIVLVIKNLETKQYDSTVFCEKDTVLSPYDLA